MRRVGFTAISLALFALAATGCSAPASSTASSASSASPAAVSSSTPPSASSSAAAFASPSYEPEPEPSYSALEAKAIETAYGADYVDLESGLATLNKQCTESMFGYGDIATLSEDQAQEITGALVLCPDHADAKAIGAKIKDSRAISAEEDDGTRFRDGTYLVGSEVQPGSYFSTGYVDSGQDSAPMENCFWQRLDADGNIIDNSFLSSARRVKVTIAKSDYSFETNNCGIWRKH